MMQIRPVSDLRNKFPEIENAVSSGNPVFLTKNGHGAMVVMSLEKYAELTEDLEIKLDEADSAAAVSDVRYTHENVFSRSKEGLVEENPRLLLEPVPGKPASIGEFDGLIKIPDDFNEPLDEMKEYMF